MCTEPLDGLGPALVHPLEHCGRFFARSARYGIHRHRRSALRFREGHIDHLVQPLDALVVVGGAGDDQMPWEIDLRELAAHPVVLAVGRAHAELEQSARPRVGLAGMDLEAFRPEPVLQVLGARPALEYAAARRVEYPGEGDGVLVHWPR